MFAKHVKTPENNESQSLPLDEVRQAEAKVAARILLARQEAEEQKLAGRAAAKARIEQAQLDGAREGKAQYERRMQETGREAEEIIAAARAQAEAIEREGQARIASAVQWALNTVLGAGREEKTP